MESIEKFIEDTGGMSLLIINELAKNNFPRPYPDELQLHVKDCLSGNTLKDIENYVCCRS